ncbi:ArsR/SmtB family transcription factor [Aerococcus viridans]|uniref:ArsR/SmtB family transcription factor n=1 Tax=Aerococcus viridans TaxID=1377 RepID=UPI003B8A7865
MQRALGLTQSTTSHYLTMMSKAGLVTTTRLGKWIYYRRNEAAIQELRKFIDKEI